jgi:cytochrome c biogenesis protein
MRSAWRFFASVKLAIVLLILITLASILGTLIPQGRSAAEYAARYGSLAGLFTSLQLTHLYHSPWYLALLLLFALNIIVCTVARLGAKWRKAFGLPAEMDAQTVSAMKIKSRFRLALPPSSARERIAGHLRSRGYRLVVLAPGNSAVLLARKRRLGQFGSDVVHVGLLVVLIGGFVSGLASRRSAIELREGQTTAVPHAPFEIRLDKFETEYYPEGAIKDWKSTVSVIENGTAVLSRVVEVNHPLTYRRVLFYQTANGWVLVNPRLEIIVKKPADATYSKTLSLKVGERLAVEDPDFTHLAVRQFVPDFVIGEGNQVETRSPEPNNPAALIEIWKGTERIYSGWTFAKFPDFGEGHKAGQASLTFVLNRYDAPQYSVLEAAKDPGVNFIWLGCLLVMLGLFLAFYWPPREIRVVLEEVGGKSDVAVGGLASKSREAFQTEFDRIVESLRRTS